MLKIFSSDKFAEMPFLLSQPQTIQPSYRLCPCLPRNMRVNGILKWKLISAANGVFYSPWEVLLIEKTKWKSRRHAEPSRWQTHPRCTWDEWLTIAARSAPRFYSWKRNTSAGFPSCFLSSPPFSSYHKQFLLLVWRRATNVHSPPPFSLLRTLSFLNVAAFDTDSLLFITATSRYNLQ